MSVTKIQNYKLAVSALKIINARKPQLEQKLREYPHALAVVRKVLDTSNLAVDVIPRQLEMIIAQEKHLHSQIRDTIGNIMTAILGKPVSRKFTRQYLGS